MKQFVSIPFVLGLIFFSCKKNDNPTVQDRLDKGASVSDILADNPVDSLYGKMYAGGYIFYVNQTEESALVVSPNTLGSSVDWSCPGNEILGADDVGVGFGSSNTDAIIAECGDPNGAAGMCFYSNEGGRTDWFLPSAEEVYFMHLNLYQKGYGNFNSSDDLWSSTEVDENQAYHFDFSDSTWTAIDKTEPKQVRAIRKE